MVATTVETTDLPATPPTDRPRWLTGLLTAVMAVALIAAGSALTVIAGVGGSRPPADDSVDAGFARDMVVHHSQAVRMAQVARDRSADPAVRLLAYDIETGQLGQVGQMRGWLQSWNLSQQTARQPMAWMSAPKAGMIGHEGMDGTEMPGTDQAGAAPVMPGMATTAELTRLRSLSGRALDVYFLQLMIRHHQGGVPMAREGADRASVNYVRGLAAKIVTAQSAEVASMERMLRTRGGSPLPPP